MIVYVYNDLLNSQKKDGWKIALESRLQYDAVSNLHILLKQAKLVVNPFFKFSKMMQLQKYSFTSYKGKKDRIVVNLLVTILILFWLNVLTVQWKISFSEPW